MAEENSLRVQSNEHKDGWGIAYYRGPTPEVIRGTSPAHADPDFERVSEAVSSHAVVAHVRLASVGAVTLLNAHPFQHGRWTFAHNGTLREFEQIASQVESLIEPALRPSVKGETDSERCFYLFLSHLTRLPGGVEDPTFDTVALALAQTARALCQLGDRPHLEPCSLNFLVTNGELMVATRRNRSLYYSDRKRKMDHPHREPEPGVALAQFIVASEKVTAEDHWHEVPQESVVGVDRQLRFRRSTFTELLSRPRPAPFATP